MYQLWSEDTQAITVQKERIEKLMEDNHRLLSTMFALKEGLKAAKADFKSMTKSVCMMNSSTDDLNKILSYGKQASDNSGVDFS